MDTVDDVVVKEPRALNTNKAIIRSSSINRAQLQNCPECDTSRLTHSRRRGRLSQAGSHPDAVTDISQSAERDDSRADVANLANAVASLTKQVADLQAVVMALRPHPETPASVKTPPEDVDRTSELDDAAQLNRDRVVQDVSWFEEVADSTSMTKATPFVPNPWMQQIASASRMDIFDGDTRKWPMFIANFRALVHETIRSDAQRMALLGQLLSPRLRSGFSGLLADPAMYREVSGPVSTMKLCGLVHDLHPSALLEHTGRDSCQITKGAHRSHDHGVTDNKRKMLHLHDRWSSDAGVSPLSQHERAEPNRRSNPSWIMFTMPRKRSSSKRLFTITAVPQRRLSSVPSPIVAWRTTAGQRRKSNAKGINPNPSERGARRRRLGVTQNK
ncbi:hypothetical protein M513_13268 [Trichuris suis]|uniref:Uncharacterized protein n=1 Tax=Trichuris suis TaxID=68888 RepID=A0A085LLK9_9BILA|nr:hypothetical protein M513_13268 [Trichuris suis]